MTVSDLGDNLDLLVCLKESAQAQCPDEGDLCTTCWPPSIWLLNLVE